MRGAKQLEGDGVIKNYLDGSARGGEIQLPRVLGGSGGRAWGKGSGEEVGAGGLMKKDHWSVRL